MDTKDSDVAWAVEVMHSHSDFTDDIRMITRDLKLALDLRTRMIQLNLGHIADCTSCANHQCYVQCRTLHATEVQRLLPFLWDRYYIKGIMNNELHPEPRLPPEFTAY